MEKRVREVAKVKRVRRAWPSGEKEFSFSLKKFRKSENARRKSEDILGVGSSSWKRDNKEPILGSREAKEKVDKDVRQVSEPV